jgi:hypothetical protein
MISSQANEICEKDSKKTIAPDHIITALNVRRVHARRFDARADLCWALATWVSVLPSRGGGRSEGPQEDTEGLLLIVCLVPVPHLHRSQDREKKMSKLEASGKTTEELIAEQELLFAQSRNRFETGNT